MVNLMGYKFSSMEELNKKIDASVAIVNDTTGKYGFREKREAENIVELAMKCNLL